MSEIDLQETLERLKHEFIDNSADKLDRIDGMIDRLYRGHEDSRGMQFVEFQRDVHSLKGSAGTYGFDSISLIAHRLEDYIETTRRLSQENLLDVQKFVDRIREILEGGDEVSNDRLTEILERLPTSAAAQSVTEEADQPVALLVMSKGVQRKVVAADLSANGFEIAYADHPLDAFRLAVSLKPSLIATSLEFDNLSGLELARALRGVDVTTETPFVIMTSHAVDGLGQQLPSQTAAIQKDAEFRSKLGNTLSEFGFTVSESKSER